MELLVRLLDKSHIYFIHCNKSINKYKLITPLNLLVVDVNRIVITRVQCEAQVDLLISEFSREQLTEYVQLAFCLII